MNRCSSISWMNGRLSFSPSNPMIKGPLLVHASTPPEVTTWRPMFLGFSSISVSTLRTTSGSASAERSRWTWRSTTRNSCASSSFRSWQSGRRGPRRQCRSGRGDDGGHDRGYTDGRMVSRPVAETRSPAPAGPARQIARYGVGESGWNDDKIRGIVAPTLITVGDCDMVRLDHSVKVLQLRGGDVNCDFEGVPARSWLCSVVQRTSSGSPGPTSFATSWSRPWMHPRPPARPNGEAWTS
jgi:hypothetical protein